MNGQLWQECPLCDVEPVCSVCMYCANHCACPVANAPRPSGDVLKAGREARLAEEAGARAEYDAWRASATDGLVECGLKVDLDEPARPLRSYGGPGSWHTGDQWVEGSKGGRRVVFWTYGNAVRTFLDPELVAAAADAFWERLRAAFHSDAQAAQWLLTKALYQERHGPVLGCEKYPPTVSRVGEAALAALAATEPWLVGPRYGTTVTTHRGETTATPSHSELAARHHGLAPVLLEAVPFNRFTTDAHGPVGARLKASGLLEKGAPYLHPDGRLFAHVLGEYGQTWDLDSSACRWVEIAP